VFASPATPTSHVLARIAALQDAYYPVVCLSASKCLEDWDITIPRWYVPGSGDDEEVWAQKLTPALFWEHTAALLQASRTELPALVESLVRDSRRLASAKSARLLDVAGWPFALALEPSDLDGPGVSFHACTPESTPVHLAVKLPPSKAGHDALFGAMPAVLRHIDQLQPRGDKVTLSYTGLDTTSGKDAILAVLLIWSCQDAPRPLGRPPFECISSLTVLRQSNDQVQAARFAESAGRAAAAQPDDPQACQRLPSLDALHFE
jgi:hypothetical protein